MGDTALLAVVVAALAVVVNAAVSIYLHVRRARFEEDLASRKFTYDVTLAERKAEFDHRIADYQRKQKLAGEILTAFYEVQRTMPAIRSPVSWGPEGQSRPRPEDGEPEGIERTRNGYYVIIERINKHRAVFARFLGNQFTAMALFGADAGKTFEDFNQVINRISTSANMLIMTVGQASAPPPMQWHADIWEGYGDLKEDRVQKDLNRIAEAVEAMCRPILTAKSPVLSDVGQR